MRKRRNPRSVLINSQRVMRESLRPRRRKQKSNRNFQSGRKNCSIFPAASKHLAEKLDKDAPVISESDRIKRQRELSDMDQDFQRKQRAFSEDLNLRRNEEIATGG